MFSHVLSHNSVYRRPNYGAGAGAGAAAGAAAASGFLAAGFPRGGFRPPIIQLAKPPG
jgi:hypothetical protein